MLQLSRENTGSFLFIIGSLVTPFMNMVEKLRFIHLFPRIGEVVLVAYIFQLLLGDAEIIVADVFVAVCILLIQVVPGGIYEEGALAAFRLKRKLIPRMGAVASFPPFGRIRRRRPVP